MAVPGGPGQRDAATDPTPRERFAGQVGAVMIGLEALVLAGIAVFYVYELLLGHGTDLMVVIMSVVTILVFVIGLGYTAAGLRRRHPRAQAPAIAFNFLLLPLGIAMFRFAPWWLAGSVLVVSVVTIVAVLLMGRLGPPRQTADPGAG